MPRVGKTMDRKATLRRQREAPPDLDRFDRKMLLRFHEEGPRFLTGGPESRAFDLFQKGLLEREWALRSATLSHRDYGWRYRISARGVAAIGWPPAATQRRGTE